MTITAERQQPVHLPGLHNVVAYHDGFYSGGVPQGDTGFSTLRRMGMKTVISVDGAAPDVAAARAKGLRYIHLPIGYDGIDESRALQLARATRDAMHNGPVYLHCHHGKHRSAGAAGTVAVMLDWASSEQMLKRMGVSGTSSSYAGLFESTQHAKPVSMAVLDDLPGDFPSVMLPQGMVKAMVEVEVIMEHLQYIETAGWRVPDDHPDLVPVAEAGRLADILRHLMDDPSVQQESSEFMQLLEINQADAATLESLLISPALNPRLLTEQFARINTSCRACHVRYRN